MSFKKLHGIDPLVVCGIDPGTRVMGFGVVGRRGRRLVHVDHGSFRPRADADAPDRLADLHAQVSAMLAHHRPHVMALEEAFLHRNVQSALRLGEARGAVMLAASAHDVPVVQYPAAVVKKSVAGHGGATKELMQDMVARHLNLDGPPNPHDAADALAMALCLLFDPELDPRFHGAGEGW